MNKPEGRRLREQNAALTVQAQGSHKLIAELKGRVLGAGVRGDAADEAAARIRELRLRVAELEEENSRLRVMSQNTLPDGRPRSRRVVKKIRKALKMRA